MSTSHIAVVPGCQNDLYEDIPQYPPFLSDDQRAVVQVGRADQYVPIATLAWYRPSHYTHTQRFCALWGPRGPHDTERAQPKPKGFGLPPEVSNPIVRSVGTGMWRRWEREN